MEGEADKVREACISIRIASHEYTVLIREARWCIERGQFERALALSVQASFLPTDLEQALRRDAPPPARPDMEIE